jgi:hypothetical protein
MSSRSPTGIWAKLEQIRVALTGTISVSNADLATMQDDIASIKAHIAEIRALLEA